MPAYNILTTKPLRFLCIIISSVFIIDALLMVFTSFFLTLPPLLKILIEPFVMIAVSSPVFYFFFFRPLAMNVAELKQQGEKIRKLNEACEREVIERADQLGVFNQKLQETNNFNQAMLQAIPFGMDIVDEEYTILFLNPHLEALVGKEAIGKKCWQLYRDDKAQCTDCPLSKGVDIGETTAIETKGLFGERIFQVSHTALLYQGKKAVLEIFQDITERRQSENELNKLSAAVMQTADLVMITDKNGLIEYVNTAFEQLTGYKKEEIIGKSPRILKSGKQDREFYDRLWKVIRSGEVFRDILVNKKKNGELYFSEKTITPLKDAQGNIINFISTDKDITKRKEAEDSIRLLQKITSFISEADDLHLAFVSILQKICEFTLWNIGELWIPNAALGYLKYSACWCKDDECLRNFRKESENLIFPLGIGIPGEVLVSKEVKWIEDITLEPGFLRKDIALQCGLKMYIVFPVKVKDEVVAVVGFFSSEFRHEEERLINFISTVISELGLAILRKRYEEELVSANRDLQRLDRLKSDFITTVSHELRTPIGIMREGVSQVMEGLHGGLNQEQKNCLSKSLNHIDRLTRIVNSILDVSKLEAGKIGLKIELIDLIALAKTVISIFLPIAQSKGLEIRSAFTREKMGLNADKDMLTQVFTCMIGNAVKFTETGYIEVSIRDEGNAVECSIQDTGMGIPADELPKVFDKFQQFSRAYGPGEKGVGLGLSIAKRIIELHKGRIWVQSEVNKGTKFSFSLPKGQIK